MAAGQTAQTNPAHTEQLEQLLADPRFVAALQSYKHDDESQNVPFVGHKQGGTVMIDRGFADAAKSGAMKYDGKSYDPRPFIRVHEAVEGAAQKSHGLPYEHAHALATAAERHAVEASGLDWNKHQQAIAPFVKQAAGQDGKRIIVLVRHGATKLNNDVDTSVDRIRGWKDVPLAPKGIEEAHATAAEMAKHPPDVLLTSDMNRAHETAKIISSKTGVPIAEVSQAFRPWNVGQFAGQITAKVIPTLARYASKTPDQKTPGGESFNDFRCRFFAGIKDALGKYPGRVAIVTHHRNERLLKAWAKAGFPTDLHIDIATFDAKGERTGSAEDIDLPAAAFGGRGYIDSEAGDGTGGGEGGYVPLEGIAIGLVQNQTGIPFRCGSCEFFGAGTCHNRNPRLSGKKVQPVWCCNLYEHAGMKTIVA